MTKKNRLDIIHKKVHELRKQEHRENDPFAKEIEKVITEHYRDKCPECKNIVLPEPSEYEKILENNEDFRKYMIIQLHNILNQFEKEKEKIEK